MDKKKKMAFIGVAAVWFGGHIGPGFATGSSLTNWFVCFGSIGIFLPIISMAVTAGVMYFMVEFARKNKTTNYKDFADVAYGDKSKIFTVLYDVIFIVTVICAGGICMSGLASLLEAQFKIPYFVGIIGIIVITALLCLYGAKVVGAISSYMMYFILATVALIVIISFTKGDCDLAGSFANSSSNATVPSIGTAIFKGVLYGVFQSTIVFNVMSVSNLLESKADTKKAVGLAYILNVAMLMVGGLMVFSYTNVFPIVGETLPFLAILTRLGMSWLTWLYVILMILAVFTSLAGLAYAGSVRFDNTCRFIKNGKSRKIVIVAVLLGIAACAASFGLKAIMSTGNTYNGYLTFFVLVIPAYTYIRAKLNKNEE